MLQWNTTVTLLWKLDLITQIMVLHFLSYCGIYLRSFLSVPPWVEWGFSQQHWMLRKGKLAQREGLLSHGNITTIWVIRGDPN